MTTTDLIVIGAGPGGYVAALRAAQLGLRVSLIEREHLGGICLNWGCIPTKALLHTADTLRRLRGADALGLRVAEPQVDFAAVMARSRQVAQRLQRGVAQLLRRAGVTVVEGQGRVERGPAVSVQSADGRTQRLTAAHVILATGARPRALPALPFDGQRVWHYRDALAAQSLPPMLAVIGGGAIGLEFASFYATLGSRVTLIEELDRLLPGSDAEVSAFVQQAMRGDGVAVHTGCTLAAAERGPEGLRLQLQRGGEALTVDADRVLVAIGLQPNVEGLGLDGTAVRVEPGRVVVDGWGATAEPGVWAIGDLTGAPMLAHRASHQAVACVERIAGRREGQQPPHAAIPSCVYAHPQSAAIGLTEDQARAQGRRVRVGRFPLQASGKAIAIGEAEGFVKTLFDADSGALLGAHLVGADAPELVHGFALADTLEATEAELFETVFPHPTLSEAMHESALAAFDRALHV